MSHQFDYNLPNYTRVHQNPTLYLNPQHIQIVSEEERINRILQSTNQSIASFQFNSHQSIKCVSQLVEWHLNSISTTSSTSQSIGSQTSSIINQSQNLTKQPKITESIRQHPDQDEEAKQEQHKTDLIPSNNDKKIKLGSAKLCHNFYFVIPRYSHKICRWKPSFKSKSCEKDTQKLLVKDEESHTVFQMNYEPESKSMDKNVEDIEETKNEIITISTESSDIDIIISITRRKQQDVHTIYELIKRSIVVIRIMTHKRIMCHSIRGRQRSKKKKKFHHNSLHLTKNFIHQRNSLPSKFSHHSCSSAPPPKHSNRSASPIS